MARSTKVLGLATYTALRAPRSDLVTLTATGVLPCANYAADLLMRPERVVPPMWSLVFFVEEVCLRAIRPFVIEAHMAVPADAPTQQITVLDASGSVRVPILDEIEPAAATFGSIGTDRFCVYARLPYPSVKTGGHVACFVAPADALVAAIYYRAYGPASRQECDDFIASSCVPSTAGALKTKGGNEVPWPAFAEE